ncbi:MAG: ABC transporter ATP-binding protein [Eubacteriales bacterium]|nr:ABC transporter ATP-binding protein [Eubacteriales bacterium]
MKINDIKDILRFVWAKSRTAASLALLCPLLNAISIGVGTILSAMIINGLISGVDSKTLILTVLVGLCLLFVLKILGSYLQNKKAVQVNILEKIFNMEIGRTTMKMDYEALESPAVGKLRARMNNDRQWGLGFGSVIRQAEGVVDGIFGVITGIVLLIPFLTTAGHVSTSLFFFTAILLSFASAAVSVRFVGDRNLKMLDEYTASSAFFGHFIWQPLNVSSVKDINLFHAYALIREHVDQRYDQKDRWTTRYARLHMTGGLVSGLSIGMIQFGANMLILLRAASESIPAGSVMLYIAAFLGVSVSFSRLCATAASLSIAAKRQKSTLEYLKSDEVAEGDTHPVSQIKKHEITFENVSYRYPGCNNFALRNVSFSITGHTRIAVVGLNGSGKSTLIKLLCRLIEPTEGRILLDGTDIKYYEIGSYRNLFGVLFQDFKLLPFTLDQNVSASTRPDRERVSSVLALSGFHDRLFELPLGIDTPLYSVFHEKGIDMSGGESQKIAIARALYRDASFIILDEPTTALDPISECKLYKEFHAFSKNKAVIFVSHRLSFGYLVDEILVFCDGLLIERGSHESLIAKSNSAYAELWKEG